MNKVDMNFANYKVYGKKSPHSNKNQLSDMLNELADVLGFDLLLLREDFSEAKGYLIEESDIDLLADMVEIAKSSAGKRIRCKDFSVEYAEEIEFLQRAFITLAEHNDVPTDILLEQEFQMLVRTKFAVMRNSIYLQMEKFHKNLGHNFFALLEYLSEEDIFTDTDKFVFFQFLDECITESIPIVRGIYLWFKEGRIQTNNKSMASVLDSMSSIEKENYLQMAKRVALFVQRLYEDEEYSVVIAEFFRIESGDGKLKDKKKVPLLVKRMSEIMDRNADGLLLPEEYAYGEQNIRTKRRKCIDLETELAESQELLEEAIRNYIGLREYRKENPLVDGGEEHFIEQEYKEIFGEEMFALQ